AAAVLILGLAVAVIPVVGRGLRRAGSSGTGIDNGGPSPREKDGGETPPTPPQKTTLRGTRGFEGRDTAGLLPQHANHPRPLSPKSDSAVFSHYKDGLYLPDGYEPVDPGNVVGPERWPRFLVRKSDGARFIRINGRTYPRGDPRQGSPAVDFD